MTKFFEYKELNKKDHYITIEELNELGKEGWELILCDSGSYIFKREVIPEWPNWLGPK